jgi:hypothetical protein
MQKSLFSSRLSISTWYLAAMFADAETGAQRLLRMSYLTRSLAFRVLESNPVLLQPFDRVKLGHWSWQRRLGEHGDKLGMRVKPDLRLRHCVETC